MIAKEVSPSVTAGGILGALVVIGGVLTLLVNPVLGVLIIIAGLIVGAVGRSKKTVLVCPACKHSIDL